MDRVLAEGMTLTTTYDGETIAYFKIAKESVGTIRRLYDEYHDCKALDMGIAKHRKRRSLDANAYAWVLMDKLAEKTGVSKEEIYRETVKNIGGNSYIYPIRKDAAEAYIRHWQKGGIGWIAEIMGDSKLDGYVNVVSCYGSSEYDTAQMSRLIKLIIGECREQGIETKTPAELAALMEEWEKRGNMNGKKTND